MCEGNSPHKKRSQHGMCKETPDIEKCQRVIFEQMCQFRFSFSLFISLCLAIGFLFVLFVGLFSKAVFMQILALVVLSFYHFEGSFHF